MIKKDEKIKFIQVDNETSKKQLEQLYEKVTWEIEEDIELRAKINNRISQYNRQNDKLELIKTQETQAANLNEILEVTAGTAAYTKSEIVDFNKDWDTYSGIKKGLIEHLDNSIFMYQLVVMQSTVYYQKIKNWKKKSCLVMKNY